MNWYKLIVAYDGTDFFGWQEQPGYTTIAGVLKSTFLQIFNQKHVYLVGASRTDAGVHAQGQVVRVGTDLPLDPEKLMRVMNNALPHAIAITECVRSERLFHPQHQVSYKLYSYRVFTQRPCPKVHRYGYPYWHGLDFKKLHDALQLFVGTHDFKAFSKKNGELNTVRTVTSIEIVGDPQGTEFTIYIQGVSFLQYMVRRMVGAALALASDNNRSINEITLLLQGQMVPVKNLPNAPAKGLCLEKIVYKGDTAL
jgi:tRNA pseudouridine38-40 synthase